MNERVEQCQWKAIQKFHLIERLLGSEENTDRKGVIAALLSPFFLGASPIFGKLATNSGADPLMVAAARTLIAVGILWVGYSLCWRKYIYIFPAGLIGCIMVGLVNGIGSIFYYGGLARLDASVAQLLNGTYLIFVVIMSWVGGTHMSRRTRLRVALAFIAVMLLTAPQATSMDWFGVGLMLGNAIMFAGHVVMSQRVLYEMPPQTFTLYVLTTMAVVVTVARGVVAIAGHMPLVVPTGEGMAAIVALAITTAVSRLLMFIGVKNLGSLQTILLGVAEVAVALAAAFLFLGERLSSVQWIGALVMVASMLLMRSRDETPIGLDRYQAMALPNFAGMRRFKATLSVNASPISGIPDEELELIRHMMGPYSGDFFDSLKERPPGMPAPDALPGDVSEEEDVHPGEYRLGPKLEDDDSED
jgi:drug/metabolite transporter (DMT)-like permease